MATDHSGELNAFIDFAIAQRQTDSDMSLHDLLDRWEVAHPTEISDEEADDIVAMVQEALDGIAAGDKGMSLEEFDREFRHRNNLPPP